MRKLFLLLAVGVLGVCLHAQGDLRDWTDEKSGATIKAEIVSKKSDSSKIELRMESGKRVWIERARLIKEHQDFAGSWIAKEDQVTARVTQSGRGYKIVKIVALGGLKDGVLYYGGTYPGGSTLAKIVKAGARVEIEARLRNDYSVKLMEGEELRDLETHIKKTGL